MPSVTISQLHWLAGFLEAEGSFHFSKASHLNVSAAQVQRWPLEKVREMVGGEIYLYASKNKKHSDCHRWTAVGSRAAGICMTLFPLMTKKRQAQITKALEGWKSIGIRGEHRTHCLYGHPLSGDNLYVHRGTRYCRQCRSYQDTIRRGWREAPKWENRHPGDKQQFQCKRGHAYVEENIYWWNGKRYCKLCKKIQKDAWYQKQKAKRTEAIL